MSSEEVDDNEVVVVGAKRVRRTTGNIRSRTSDVWLYFEKKGDFYECKVAGCGAQYKSKVTTTLKRHIATHSIEEINDLSTFSRRSIIPLEERIVQWVVKSMVPFYVIENEEFACLFNEQVPSRKVLKGNIKQKFKTRKANLKQFFSNFPNKISFSFDLWTSVTRESFLGITAHFINDFQLEHVTLALKKVLNHKGKYISEIFMQVIEEFGLLHKLGWITCDNASSNDTFFEGMQLQLNLKAIDIDIKERQTRCLCHVINLVVQDLLDAKSMEVDTTEKPKRKKRLSSDKRAKDPQDGGGECI